MGDLPITRQGYENLRKKLEYLKNEALPKAEQRLGAARELGDLSENSEFDAAREELWRLERLIGEVADLLGRAEVVDASKVDQTVVSFGATVKILNMSTNKTIEYTIVGDGETDSEKGQISISSPLAQGLLGARKDEVREIELPAGKQTFKILGYHYNNL